MQLAEAWSSVSLHTLLESAERELTSCFVAHADARSNARNARGPSVSSGQGREVATQKGPHPRNINNDPNSGLASHSHTATLLGPVLCCIEADFCDQLLILQDFSRSIVAPIGRKKSASTSPEKKNIWRRRGTLKSQHRLGRPSETGRPGVRLWRPGGYLRFTLGLRWANVGLTFG